MAPDISDAHAFAVTMTSERGPATRKQSLIAAVLAALPEALRQSERLLDSRQNLQSAAPPPHRPTTDHRTS